MVERILRARNPDSTVFDIGTQHDDNTYAVSTRDKDTIGRLDQVIAKPVTPTGLPVYGEVDSVPQLGTSTVVSYTVQAGDTLRGFIGSGNRSGKFALRADGTTILSGRVDVTASNVSINLPISYALDGVSTLQLVVENIGQGVGDFEGSLLIEQ